MHRSLIERTRLASVTQEVDSIAMFAQAWMTAERAWRAFVTSATRCLLAKRLRCGTYTRGSNGETILIAGFAHYSNELNGASKTDKQYSQAVKASGG